MCFWSANPLRSSKEDLMLLVEIRTELDEEVEWDLSKEKNVEEE